MYLPEISINSLRFKKVGKNVLISDRASFYRTEKISIGDNVRIDDFTILSAGDGGIEISNDVHIGCHSSLIGKGKISIGSFTEISGRVSIYSSTNDFKCEFYKKDLKRINIISEDVAIEKNVVVGSGSVVLPGVTIKEKSRIGSLSLVRNDVEAKEIHAGIPAKKISNVSTGNP